MNRGGQGDASSRRDRIAAITLDEKSVVRRAPEIEHERAVAIFDLIEENSFRLKTGAPGPYALHLSIEENRLVLDVRDQADKPLEKIALPVASLRKLIKDYFQVCESYFAAIRLSAPSQIEAIDVGRRALHNEGSDRLRERLGERIEIDLATARRLFTLVCVLHVRG
jgi:uncharacterized protein (UPF0262 family)